MSIQTYDGFLYLFPEKPSQKADAAVYSMPRTS